MVRAIELGRAVMYGDQLAFEPAFDGHVEADVGQDADLVVGYLFREGSLRKEMFDIVITTELDGTQKESSRIQMEDRPGVDDVMKGEVRHRARFPWKGDVPLQVTIEAVWKAAPWSGQGAHRSIEAKHVEKAFVRVR